MQHAPRRFDDAQHFARSLAALTEQIESGGARGIDYERLAEPRTCAPVRAVGSPVEDLLAERVRLRLVLRYARNAGTVRLHELRAWEVVRVGGVQVTAYAEAVDRTRRTVQQWLRRADAAVVQALSDRDMLAARPRHSAQEAERARGVVWSSAWAEDEDGVAAGT